jgi:hypothetical protein
MNHMRLLIIPAALMFQLVSAQNGTMSLTSSQQTEAKPVQEPSSPAVTMPAQTDSPSSADAPPTAILDYKSVYEAATIEEEVKMAAERFSLSPSQQDVWLTAATDRRAAEKQSQDMLGSKAANYDKEGAYRGLRTAHNTFHQSIVGFLSPAQKQAFERDRLILQEKQQRLAKLPPPPPPAPTVTVAPVDSSAIKETDEKKSKGKKSKKKKKAVGS